MRLVPISQRLFECLGRRVIDIQIDKFDLARIFCLEPMHDGRYRLTGRSPEGEELYELEISGLQLDLCWIGRFQARH